MRERYSRGDGLSSGDGFSSRDRFSSDAELISCAGFRIREWYSRGDGLSSGAGFSSRDRPVRGCCTKKEDAVQKRRARRKNLRGTKNEGRGSLGTQKSKQKKGGTGEAGEKAKGGLFTLFFFFFFVGAKREVQAGEKEGVNEEKNAKRQKDP